MLFLQGLSFLCTYISSVYSQFSDIVGLTFYNIPSSGVLMKSIGAEFLRPNSFPGVNHNVDEGRAWTSNLTNAGSIPNVTDYNF